MADTAEPSSNATSALTLVKNRLRILLDDKDQKQLLSDAAISACIKELKKLYKLFQKLDSPVSKQQASDLSDLNQTEINWRRLYQRCLMENQRMVNEIPDLELEFEELELYEIADVLEKELRNYRVKFHPPITVSTICFCGDSDDGDSVDSDLDDGIYNHDISYQYPKPDKIDEQDAQVLIHEFKGDHVRLKRKVTLFRFELDLWKKLLGVVPFSSLCSSFEDGSALTLVNRRLQELRNKICRIHILEGQPCNTRQKALVQSKPVISACINELEKLRQDLASAAGQQASSLDSNPNHNEESAKIISDVLDTGNSRPSQVNQQNEGNFLSSRMEMAVNWRIKYYNYLMDYRRLVDEVEDAKREFRELKLDREFMSLRSKLYNKMVPIDAHPDQNDENSLSDQQDEGISLHLGEAKVKEILNATRNKHMVEVDWKRYYQELKKKNIWMQREVNLYKKELTKWREYIAEHPSFLDGRPPHSYLCH